MMFKGAEWKTGKNWANKINLLGCDIYGGRYKVEVGNQKNDKGNWEGFVITVDQEETFVTEEQYKAFEQQHEELSEVKDQLSVVDEARSPSDSTTDGEEDSDDNVDF